MINLLPTEYKKELRAARMNVVLLRYNVITASAVVFLMLTCGIFFAILTTNKITAEDTNKVNEEKASSYASTKQQAEEYRNNLAVAKQILTTEINYTDVVFAVTSLLPKGVILNDLTLSAADFGNQTTITAQAKDYDAATALKERFQESQVFSNVSFQTISDSQSEGGGNSAYPINVTMSVTVNKELQ